MIEKKKFLIFQFRRRVVLIMTGVSLTSVASCLEYFPRYYSLLEVQMQRGMTSKVPRDSLNTLSYTIMRFSLTKKFKIMC